MRVRILGQYANFALVLLWATEFVLLLASNVVAYWMRGDSPPGITAWLQPVTFAIFATIGLTAMGMYSARQRDRLRLMLSWRIAMALGLGSTAAIIAAFVFREGHFNARTQLVATALSWVIIVIVRLWILALVPDRVFKRRVLVYGSGRQAQSISRLRRRADRRGFEIVGYLAANGEIPEVPSDKVLRGARSIIDITSAYNVDEVVVAMDDRRQHFPSEQLLECRLAGIDVVDLLTFLERETGKLHIEILSASWLIFSGGFRRDAFRRFTERCFDVAASAGLLATTWPLMALVALAIKLEDGWGAPVLYRQTRVGYAGRTFELMKFRSMRPNSEPAGHAVWARVKDARATRVGAVIRRTRLDELPQMLTVLKGDMSFVGPRPERPEFVRHFEATIPFYRERHFVKPGITGWAQLCYPYGASERDAREKLQYDLYYVKNHNLLFDFLILLQTVEVILLGKGAR